MYFTMHHLSWPAGRRLLHGVERRGSGSIRLEGAAASRSWQTRGMSVTSLNAHDQAGVPALPGTREPCVLLKLGEIVLKGGNRRQFEQRLQSNIRQAMEDAGFTVRIWQRYGVIMLRAAEDAGTDPAAAEAAVDKIAERARDVMGIARVCRAVRVPKQPQAAIDTAVAMMAGKTGSFAVRARRRDKRFPATSSELATAIGTRVQREY